MDRNNVVDRHRFDADTDPDPTFHFEAEVSHILAVPVYIVLANS